VFWIYLRVKTPDTEAVIFMDELLLGQKLPEITNLLLKKLLQNNNTSVTQKEVVLGSRKN